MEPASLPVTKGRGSLEDPEVLENVPGHVIPILEREFDDFDTESTKFLAARRRGDRVHRLPPQAGRLRPAPARRADDPREAAVRRHHARADGGLRGRHRALRAAATRATSPRARTSRSTTSRCTDAAKLIRELADAGLSSREGCGNTVRNVTGDPWAGVAPGRALRPHPVRRRLRALLRAPPDDAARCRARSRRPSTASPEDRAITGIHDIAFLARERDGVSAASRSASAAARRSCRASRRRSTTSSGSTTAST